MKIGKNLLFVLLFASITSYAQNKSLGVGTPTPNANAALHVESPTNNQGFIMPRLTTAQRTGLSTLLTATDNGLMLYDTNLKTIFIWDGTAWNGSRLSYPYKDSVTTALTGNDVFALKYNNAASKRVLRVESLSPTNLSSAVSVQQNGAGIGIFSRVDNASAGTSAIFGTTNSNLGGALAPVGVYGESTGTGSSAGSFRINNASNTFTALYSETNGTGPTFIARQIGSGNASAGSFRITGATNTGAAIYSQTDGTGAAIQGQTSTGFAAVFGKKDGSGGNAIQGEHSGTNGTAGTFLITNASSDQPSIFGSTIGTGSAANFTVNNSSATQPALNVVSNSNTPAAPGSAGKFEATGTGRALTAEINNAINTSRALSSTHAGLGRAGHFQNTNTANTEPTIQVQSNSSTAPGININHSGTGNAITANRPIQATQFIGDGSLLTNLPTGSLALPFTGSSATAANIFDVTTTATGGNAANFTTNNASNPNATVSATTNGGGGAGNFTKTSGGIFYTLGATHSGNGSGGAGLFQITNAANSGTAISGSTSGTGSAGAFGINNVSNTFPALFSETNGTGPALVARQIGTGNATAGVFRITGSTNTFAAVYSQTDGTGTAITGQTSTGFASVYGRREGATNGNAGLFEITDAGNTFPALQSRTVGTGSAANFEVINNAATQPALNVVTNADNTSVARFTRTGTSSGGANAIEVTNDGIGAGGTFTKSTGSGFGSSVEAVNRGAVSPAGAFSIDNVSNPENTVFAQTNGTGAVTYFSHNGASGNIAIFANNFVNVARIDKTGRGFFNGGTQASGADVAEMFDVEGSKSQYEPGDVLVISESTDRTVEKSSAPASTKVVGVYATKPGVVLTEKGMDENLDQLVPMGVIGVIPTKVCNENGAIKRGDLLVTSSTRGHAMKAIPVNVGGVLIYPTGAILGKALENFEGQASGLIKVLVNVK